MTMNYPSTSVPDTSEQQVSEGLPSAIDPTQVGAAQPATGPMRARELVFRIDALTARQKEVLVRIAEGMTNREIAGDLAITEGTVKNVVTRILDELGVTDRTKLAVAVVRWEMARPDRAIG